MDLTWFSSLKAELKKLIWDWQCDKINAGQSLNKYTVVILLHQATENCLNKPGVIENGFKRAGLYPWNKGAPDTTKLMPGTIFTVSSVRDSTQEEHSFQTPSPGVRVSSNGLAEIPATLPGAIISTTVQDDFMTPLSGDRTTTRTVSQVELESFLPHVREATYSQDDIQTFTTGPGESSISLDKTTHPFVMDCTVGSDELDSIPSSVRDLTVDQDDYQTTYYDDVHSTPAQTTSAGVTDFTGYQDTVMDTTVGPDDSSIVRVSNLPPNQIQTNTPDNNTSLKCPKCARGIPQKVFEIHTSSCSVTPAPTTIQTVPELRTVPELSLKERGRQLQKFEFLLLSEETAEEFNQLFTDRKLDIQEPLFQSWLILKNASLPTEAQALDKVLGDHTASNVPKNKTNRKRNLPIGPARYDPSSPEWEEILQEQASKKKNPAKIKKKPAPAQSNKKKAPANPKQNAAKTSKRKLRL